MSKIKRAFVTFEQAKLLWENKFFNADVLKWWITFNGHTEPSLINYRAHNDAFIQAPEHWQVIEWLRITHNIWVEVHHIVTNGVNRFHLIIWRYTESDYRTIHCSNGVGYEVYDNPQEAYSAAIDYVLKDML